MPLDELPHELTAAADSFDAATVRPFEHEAERQRQQTLQRFPRESWPAMELLQYAQGQDEVPDNYCRWIERQTDQMGSIRGGAARKLIVYKHRGKPGYHYPPDYDNVEEAWAAVRSGFTQALELAEAGRWAEIDAIEALRPGPALLIKTLYAYFPRRAAPGLLVRAAPSLPPHRWLR
jgi:5-methylcytosine-specific restriction protein B